MRRHTLRTYTGKYKKQRFYNKKENRKTWFEVMCLAVLAIWGGVAADIHPIAEAYYSLPDKIEITRESKGKTSSSGGATDNTGGMVTTVPLADSSNDGVVVTPKSEPRPTPSNESIEGNIREAWEGTGEEENALKVFKCESWRGGSYDTSIIGDKALAFWHNGQLYGRSIGVAQIRTGGIERNGKVWVASDNVEEFEERMKNPEENLKVGRAKYDASKKANGNGWYPWKNCATKAGLIQE